MHTAIIPLIGRILVTVPMALDSLFPENSLPSAEMSGKSAPPVPRSVSPSNSESSPPHGRPGIYIGSSLISGDDSDQEADAKSGLEDDFDYSSCAFVVGYIDALQILLGSHFFDVVALDSFEPEADITVFNIEDLLETELKALCKRLIDIVVLPLVTKEAIEKDNLTPSFTTQMRLRKESKTLDNLKDHMSVHTMRLFSSLNRIGMQFFVNAT